MDYLQSLKAKLRAVQSAEVECITESGYVHPSCRYRFQLLVQEAASLRDQIIAIEIQEQCNKLGEV